MAEKNPVNESRSDQEVIDKARDFWSKYNKPITIVAAVIIILGGGWLVYKNYVKEPKEKKAAEALFKAEEYYRMDSLQKSLQGDGVNAGFLKVISTYGGTKAGNLARLYAGDVYLKLEDNNQAIKHLKEFESSSKPYQARAYKLLGDAHADLGKFKDAKDYYVKSANEFKEDDFNSSEALFLAGYLAHKSMNDKNEAISLYKELKERYPNTTRGIQVDQYLAELGVYKVEE